MNNIKRFPRFVKSIQVQDVIPSQEVRCSPRKFISSLNANKKKVLNYLLFMGNRYQDVYLRQDTIAKVFKLSRETVNRIISYLCELNLINKVTRHNKSCLYRISSWFLETDTRTRLKDMLFSLTFIPLLYLYAGSSSHDIIKGEIFKQNQLQEQNQLIYLERARAREIPENKITKSREGQESVLKSEIIERLVKLAQLDVHAMLKLNDYSEGSLLSIERTLKNNRSVSNPAGYLFSLLKKVPKEKTKDSLDALPRSVSDSVPVKYISDNFGLTNPEEQVHFKAPMYNQFTPAPSTVNISETWRKSPAEMKKIFDTMPANTPHSVKQQIINVFKTCFTNHQFDEVYGPDRSSEIQKGREIRARKEKEKQELLNTIRDPRREEAERLLAQIMGDNTSSDDSLHSLPEVPVAKQKSNFPRYDQIFFPPRKDRDLY